MKVKQSCSLWRLVWVLLVVAGGALPARADSGQVILFPVLGAHLTSCLIVGGVLLGWRERVLIRWGVFLLAFLSLSLFEVFFPDREALFHLKTFIWALVVSGLTPVITAGVAYGCVRWWRGKSGGL